MVNMADKNAPVVNHRAGRVLVDPWTLIENGYVAVCAGRIVGTGRWADAPDAAVEDHGPGLMMPGLVNAHTHLELSALKDRLPFGNFEGWVRKLLAERTALGEDALVRGAQEGVGELARSGCVLAGEITTLGISAGMLEASPLSGVWFREYLGGAIDLAPLGPREEGGVRCALAGHAPHTTAPDVLVALKRETRRHGLPFSIHVAESEAERDFIRTGEGPWASLLKERGIDFSAWGLPAESPVRHLARLNLLDPLTLAVHMIVADGPDIETFAQTGAHLCLCPRSNENLHGRLPDLPALLKASVPLCLGTDSLASVSSLSVFDEMAFLAGRFGQVDPKQILAMATLGGAAALGTENCFGTLQEGRLARFLYLEGDSVSGGNIIENIVNSHPGIISKVGE